MLAALPAGGVLAAGGGLVQRLCQLNCRQHLDLLGLQLGGLKADRLFHRGQCQQLHQVVLDHVASGADAVVVAAATAQADVFGHGDLDVVDVVRVPDRVEQLIGESQRQDVLDRLLAQVVVDAEDRILGKDAVDHFVEIARAVQVVTERLLDDNPAPAVLLGFGQPGLVQLLADRRETLRRNGEVERVIAADTPFGVELVQRSRPAARTRRHRRMCLRRNGIRRPADPRSPAGTAFGSASLTTCRTSSAKACVVPVPTGEPDQGEVGRQQAAVGQVVDGRDHLFAGQVAGHTEDHHRTRCRRFAAAAYRTCPATGSAMPRRSSECSAGLICRRSRAASGSRRAALSTSPRTSATPSFSRTRNTSVRSTPIASSLSKTSWAARRGAGDRVAGHLAVVGDRVNASSPAWCSRCSARPARSRRACRSSQGSSRRSMPTADAEPVLRRPRACEAVAADEDLLVGRVGQPGVGNAGLRRVKAFASSEPIFSKRLSISVSTRDTKNEATEWILDRSCPACLAASSPSR